MRQSPDPAAARSAPYPSPPTPLLMRAAQDEHGFGERRTSTNHPQGSKREGVCDCHERMYPEPKR